MSNLPNWLDGEEPLPPSKPEPPKKPSGFNPLALAGGLVAIFVGLWLTGVVLRAMSPAPESTPEAVAVESSPVPTFAMPGTWTPDPSIPTPAPTNTPEPTATAGPTNTPEPTATPAPTLAPDEALALLIEDELIAGNRDVPRVIEVDITPGIDTLFVDWNINDSFDDLRAASVQVDLATMMRVVVQNGSAIAYKDVAFRGYFPLVDALGNVRDGLVVQAWYDRTTLEQINWDNFLHKNTYVIAKTLRLHDDFKE